MCRQSDTVLDSKVSSCRNKHIQLISVVFEPGKEMLFIKSKVSFSNQNQ